LGNHQFVDPGIQADVLMSMFCVVFKVLRVLHGRRDDADLLLGFFSAGQRVQPPHELHE
jgi:hypothetical protein